MQTWFNQDFLLVYITSLPTANLYKPGYIVTYHKLQVAAL